MKNLPQTILCLLICLPFFALAQQEDYSVAIDTHRQHYIQELTTSVYAPILAEDVEGLRFFEADESYRVTAAFEESIDAKPFSIPTYSGMKKKFIKYGTLTFDLLGTTYQLAVYRNLQSAHLEMYKDLLFLPMKDQTSGETTYGGGRYLDLKTGDIQRNKVVLDFNKLYNPYCAYGDGWNCPIPPVENHLDVAIKAGEMNYEGTKRDRGE